MDFKCLCPEDFIKLSTSISLFLTEKFDEDSLEVIKNLLCSIAGNISSYCSQKNTCKKNKKDYKK